MRKEEYKKTYRNSWTLNARVKRWTLDAGLWTLDSGHLTLDAECWTLDAGLWTLDAGLWTLGTVVVCCRTESKPSFWTCLIKLLKILSMQISKEHGHTCSVETIGCDVAIFRILY